LWARVKASSPDEKEREKNGINDIHENALYL
jgi:hypothetical protein